MKKSETLIMERNELNTRYTQMCETAYKTNTVEAVRQELNQMHRDIQRLDDEIRREQNREIEVGDGVTVRFYTDAHAGTVIRKTKTMLIIQQDKATLDPSFTPEFDVGGFAAHCSNNNEQKYNYERDPEGTIYKARWSEKDGCYKYDGCCRISRGRHEFYDYNF